jgi:hypothetical protein
MPFLEGLNELINSPNPKSALYVILLAIVKLCETNFYDWYIDPHNAYMDDVFNGYRNLLNGTLDVVVHEWAPNLNTSLENLSFQITNISIMMHFCYLDTFVYVHVIHVIFQ